MTAIQDGLIWMSGHSPAHCRDATPAERWALSRAGLLVLAAYLVASINWGVVGWVYSANLTGETRWFAAGLITLVGSGLMVLLLDRSFLFMMDSAAPENGVINRIRNLLFAFFRVAVILGFSTLTAQFTMPIYLGAELDVTALEMIEKRESDRSGNLAATSGLDDRKKTVESAISVVENWSLAIENGEKNLERMLAESRACWGRWERSVRSNTSDEVPRDMARRFAGPRGIARECTSNDTSVKTQRVELHVLRDSHRRATEALTVAQADLDATNRQIAKTMAERSAIEQRALNGTSATVLAAALEDDSGILAKWALITALQIVLELLPFFVKLFSGSSAVGARIASQRHEERRRVEARRDQIDHNQTARKHIAATANKALVDAANSTAIRTAMTEHLKAYVVALAPQEGVRALLTELSTNADDVREFSARHPQYASLASKAWHRAIRESVDSLMSFEETLTEKLMNSRPIDPDAVSPVRNPRERETSVHEQ